MNCDLCGEPIHPDRMELLPNTRTCVRCSTEEPIVGFMIYNHKTAGEVFIAKGKENCRILDREYTRAR